MRKEVRILNSFSLDEAKKLIDEYYEYAKTKEYIKRPLAWAIYKTWYKINECGEKKVP